MSYVCNLGRDDAHCAMTQSIYEFSENTFLLYAIWSIRVNISGVCTFVLENFVRIENTKPNFDVSNQDIKKLFRYKQKYNEFN